MYSVIDQNKQITATNWVISLVVKPKGKNPEHAILIVEGASLDGLTMSLKRYEFRMGEITSNILNGAVMNCRGRVDINKYMHRFSAGVNAEEQSRFFWANVMNDIKMERGCHGLSWNISDKQAIVLAENVEKDANNPPDYHLSGEHAVLPKSSGQSGHNCFTWAHRQLYRLGVQVINEDERLKISFKDFLAARTSNHLPVVDPELPAESGFCCIL